MKTNQLLLIPTAFAVIACSDAPVIAGPDPVVTGKQVLRNLSAAPGLTLDAQFDALNREVPGFAGLSFSDDGTLVIHLTQSGSADEAKSKVASHLQQNGRENGQALAALATIRPAKYEFRELAEWKRSLTQNAAGIQIVSLDIDEVRNRLNVGVIDATSLGRLRRLVLSRGIPEDAITTIIDRPAEVEAQLSDTYRPMYGSLRIHFGNPSDWCTLGYLALLDYNTYVDSTDVYVVTAAHCGGQQGVVTGYNFCQMDCTATEGWEVADPARFQYATDPWQSPSDCPNNGSLCRYSDAALFIIDSAQIWHGAMGVTCSGITLCDSYSLANWNWPYSNQAVRKVGATTGYTTGNITATCVDRTQTTGLTVLCQYRASYSSAGGDSGSPVVTPCTSSCGGFYNPVTVLGVHWGADSGGNRYFSPIAMVSNEIALAMSIGGLKVVH